VIITGGSSGLGIETVRALTGARAQVRPCDPFLVYAQSKSADGLLAAGISRRWAEHGITADACAPGFIHTNLVRHLGDATMRAMGAMGADGNMIIPDYCKTPAQGAATTVLPAASPPLAGVTGRHFEDRSRRWSAAAPT
jgi:NAD(P)-dependent dehydrogenase (short-subunit alcohol dehydrogenase family)